MPAIGSEWIKVRSEDHAGGEPFSFKTEISVDRDGKFTLTIPEELFPTVLANAKAMSEVSVGKMRVNYYVMTSTKAKGIEFLRRVAQDYIACEVVRELVILYTTSAHVTYYKLPDGVIVPNGAFDREYNSRKPGTGGGWHGLASTDWGHSWYEGNTYSVGLMACVYVRITAKRKSGDQIGWERFSGDHHAPTTYADKLNSFVGGGFADRDRDRCQSMPYTEEAAEFFYNAMLAVCKLSDRIESFFGDVNNIHRAIEARTGFLLGGGKTE